MSRCSKGKRVKRGQTRRAHGLKRVARSRRARIGRSRDVPARQLSVAEVDRRRQTQRSVRSPFHPIWSAYGDGGLAHGRERAPKAQRAGRVRRGVEGRVEAETHHVTAVEIGDRLARVRGRFLAMEGTSDRSG
jgi:hypothetical protein